MTFSSICSKVNGHSFLYYQLLKATKKINGQKQVYCLCFNFFKQKFCTRHCLSFPSSSHHRQAIVHDCSICHHMILYLDHKRTHRPCLQQRSLSSCTFAPSLFPSPHVSNLQLRFLPHPLKVQWCVQIQVLIFLYHLKIVINLLDLKISVKATLLVSKSFEFCLSISRCLKLLSTIRNHVLCYINTRI